jgi:hypothetical protein
MHLKDAGCVVYIIQFTCLIELLCQMYAASPGQFCRSGSVHSLLGGF